MAGHATASGDYALGGDDSVDVVGTGLDADEDDLLAVCGEALGFVRIKGYAADRCARAGIETLSDEAAIFFGFLFLCGIKTGQEQLVELHRLYPHKGLAFVYDFFTHHIYCGFDGCLCGAFAVARLQEVEAPLLDGKLDVLDVAIVGFEPGDVGEQLLVYRGHLCGHLGDRLGSAHSGDDVFALGFDEVFAVELFFACGGVARKANASGRVVIVVAKDHGLYVDGGAEPVVDLVQVAIIDGAVVVPGSKDGFDSAGQLLAGILDKGCACLFLDQGLVLLDELFELVYAEVGIGFDTSLVLEVVEDVFKLVFVDVEHHITVPLDKAAVGVVGKSLIAG